MANTIFRRHGKHILQYRCGCCGAGLTCPYEGTGALQAVHHGTLDLATLLAHLARHNMAEKQGGTFSCRASLA